MICSEQYECYPSVHGGNIYNFNLLNPGLIRGIMLVFPNNYNPYEFDAEIICNSNDEKKTILAKFDGMSTLMYDEMYGNNVDFNKKCRCVILPIRQPIKIPFCKTILKINTKERIIDYDNISENDYIIKLCITTSKIYDGPYDTILSDHMELEYVRHQLVNRKSQVNFIGKVLGLIFQVYDEDNIIINYENYTFTINNNIKMHGSFQKAQIIDKYINNIPIKANTSYIPFPISSYFKGDEKILFELDKGTYVDLCIIRSKEFVACNDVIHCNY